MKRWCAFIVFSTLGMSFFGQTCSTAQSLTSPQQVSISSTIAKLDTALKHEDLHKIDSLSAGLKNSYGDQAGLPDALENYFVLTSNSTWLDVPKSLSLSRILIAADTAAYVDLWKMAKGMKPPLYQSNSIFLRTSAEVADGLLKIASKETDASRKALYQSWALKALDSLATMQLPNGAFPFPDLRTQGDPVFAPIIQNFLNSCGADSVKVLKNGWIVDDKGTGEFKFDAGVIANAYYEAHQYTGNIKYKSIAISIGNYLKTLKLNVN